MRIDDQENNPDSVGEHRETTAARVMQALITEGLASGLPKPVDADYWRAKREQFGL